MICWGGRCKVNKSFVPTCTIFQRPRITANFPVTIKIYDDDYHHGVVGGDDDDDDDEDAE